MVLALSPKRGVHMISVDQKKVERLLSEGVSMNQIGERLNIPISAVKRVRAGKKVTSCRRYQKKHNEKMCSCCGIRRVYKHNRYLCQWCYENAGQPEIQGYGFEEAGPLRRDALGVADINRLKRAG